MPRALPSPAARPVPCPALAALTGIALLLAAGLPAAAAPVAGSVLAVSGRAAPPTPLVMAAEPGGASVQLAQYYAPRPPPPRYHRPHRRCWTTTQRVVQVDRWGRRHVRYVPRTVCGYR